MYKTRLYLKISIIKIKYQINLLLYQQNDLKNKMTIGGGRGDGQQWWLCVSRGDDVRLLVNSNYYIEVHNKLRQRKTILPSYATHTKSIRVLQLRSLLGFQMQIMWYWNIKDHHLDLPILQE